MGVCSVYGAKAFLSELLAVAVQTEILIHITQHAQPLRAT